MKQKILLIGFVLIQFTALTVNGQVVFTKNDTLNIQTDSLVLCVDNQRGDVIWQYSKTLDEWIDLSNETTDSLIFHSIDSSGFYRAMVVDGTCEPVFSDTTYVIRALTDSIINAILNDSSKIGNQIALFDSQNENSTITIIDTSSVTPVVQIITTELPDTIQPGWLIVDTTGVGRIFMVTDYTIQKSGEDFITKIIDGVQVGIDFLITDQTLSYSSPANRTKLEWNNSLKLNNSGMLKGDITYNLEQGEQNIIVNNSNELLSLNFLNKELWNLNTGTTTMRFWIESGTISLKPALDFYAEYIPSVVATKLLSSLITLNPFLSLPEFTTKGSLNDLKLITYNDFDIDLKLKIEASVHQDISDKIKPVKLVEYFYSIPAGPIFITVKTELFARLIFEATGEVSVNPEVQWNNNIVLGVVGNKNGTQFNKEFVTSYSDKKSLSSSIEGNFNFRQRLEIVPKIEVYAMGMVGMNAETIPFQEFTFNASITDSNPLIYDYSFDVGVDASASFDISAFHMDNVTLSLFKKDLEILAKKNVFSAPYTLEYLSGNNQTGNPGQYLSSPLSVKAIDSRGSIMKNFPVFYDVVSGGGNFQSNYSLSNNYGISENNWLIGNSGSQTSRTYLKKANQQIINRSVLNFNAAINQGNLPTLTTTAITNITQTTATSGGNITSDGGATVTARGVCWSTNQNPTTANNKTTNGTGNGSFVSNLTGLTANTTYYVRAYATNSKGTAYGNEVTFTANGNDNNDITSDFTDPNFLAAVREVLGKGINDPIFKTDNFTAITYLNVNNKSINSLAGLQHFTELKRLDCMDNLLTTLPILPSGLTELQCFRNMLTILPILPTSLTLLGCGENQLTTLPSLPQSLTVLRCWENYLTSLTGLPSGLQVLQLDNNLVNNLPALPTGLTQLDCSNNQLASVPILPVGLQYFDCSNNQLTSLPELPSGLTWLECDNNQLTSLDVSILSKLEYLFCSYNFITGVKLNNIAPYNRIDVRYNNMMNESAVTGREINWSGEKFTFLPQNGDLIIYPSNNCATAPVMDVNTIYTVALYVADYTLAAPIEGESYNGNDIRGFWLAFQVPSNWGPDHNVRIFNVSDNFDPVFGIKGNCAGNYLGNEPDMAGFVNANGSGGSETSDTNLPGSDNFGDADNTYYIRIYHYKGSETPRITFNIVVE